MTQQGLADALAKAGIELDRVSIGRIEGGGQMPSAEALEAMAAILGTNLDFMLNYTPKDVEMIRKFQKLSLKEQKRLIRIAELEKEDEQVE